MLKYSETSAWCEWATTTGLAESTSVDPPVRGAKHTRYTEPYLLPSRE